MHGDEDRNSSTRERLSLPLDARDYAYFPIDQFCEAGKSSLAASTRRNGARLCQVYPTQGFIYLASPYTSYDVDTEESRFQAAARATQRLLRTGVMAISPIVHCHPTREWGEPDGDYTFWQAFNETLLAKAEELWILTLPGWKESKGILTEANFAEGLQTPIRLLDAGSCKL